MAVKEARYAAAAAWKDLNQSLQELADPRWVVRSHPWWAVGAASALGFAVGSGFWNQNGESEGEDTYPTAHTNGEPPRAGETGTKEHKNVWVDRLFDLAKVALSSGIATLAQAHADKTSEQSVPPTSEPTTV